MGGLLVAGIFTNSGDLPIAYITTLSSGSLFTTADSNKGIAYCVLFLAVFVFSMFNLGAFRLIERDFKGKVSDMEAGTYDPNIDHSPGLRRLLRDIRQWYNSRKGKQLAPSLGVASDQKDISTVDPKEPSDLSSTVTSTLSKSVSRQRPCSTVAQKTVPGLGTLDNSDSDSDSEIEAAPPENITDLINAYSNSARKSLTPRHSLNSMDTDQSPKLDRVSTTVSIPSKLIKTKQRQFHQFIKRYRLTLLWEFIKNFARPPSAALIISITFTMIPQVRRLFYAPADTASHGIPDAPDGAPILGFAMDFTSFVGNATVPLGLAMLGATMARLSVGKLPKGFWKNVVLMAVLKLVVLPIIAVAWTKKMRSLGWIAEDNHMALFVMLVSSGVPSSTSQVYLTAIYSPPGVDRKEMNCLAAFLIAQYILLVFSMTILLTYTLKNVLSL